MVGTWRSAVAFDALSVATLVRASLDALGYRYSREAGARAFTENVLVVGLPRSAVTHRFEVESPATFRVEAYDTRPTPAAVLPFLEVAGLDEASAPHARRLLVEVARRAPRPPWAFTFRQRLALGLALPEFRRARRAWRAVLEE